MSLNVRDIKYRYQHKRCQIKQYFKEGRALLTETIINDPYDLRVGRDIANLPYLQKIGREVDRRLLDVQRVSQDCTLSQESVESVVQPTVGEDGQRLPLLRFGDIRVMAQLATLILFLHLPNGFIRATLREQVVAYLGLNLDSYRPGQMTYVLHRLRLKGILYRVPGTHRYLVTPYGYRVTLLFIKLNACVFRTTFASFDDTEPIPWPLVEALAEVDHRMDQIIDRAKLGKAA
ncbi:MAG: hypothetical protein M1358_15975 [Chloroflexi bacterium]|nr:hypothetical protein [Chloroflexota bacterium]